MYMISWVASVSYRKELELAKKNQQPNVSL